MDGFWKDSYFSSSTSFSSRNYVGRSKCEGRKSVNFLRTIQLRVTRVSGLTADIRRFSIEKTRIITDARSSRTNLSRESYSVSSIVKKVKKKKNIPKKKKLSLLSPRTGYNYAYRAQLGSAMPVPLLDKAKP